MTYAAYVDQGDPSGNTKLSFALTLLSDGFFFSFFFSHYYLEKYLISFYHFRVFGLGPNVLLDAPDVYVSYQGTNNQPGPGNYDYMAKVFHQIFL